MKSKRLVKIAVAAAVMFVTLALGSVVASAQSTQLQGIIDGRKGETMMVKSADGSIVNVVLSDTTQVEEVEDSFHIDGYTIQVKGYSSSVSSAALNQQLSTERANNVTEFMEQQGHIPLTHILCAGSHGHQPAGCSGQHERRPGRQPPRGGKAFAK
jgi:hypothetical protein